MCQICFQHMISMCETYDEPVNEQISHDFRY